MVTVRWCALALALGAVTGLAADPRDRGADTIDVAAFEPRYQELYKVFAVKCSKCHSLSRAINARLKADEWALYVKKMRRRPGSGISDANAEALNEFLAFYTKEKGKPRPP